MFDSTFWLYWRTMFAFENWHSALEMKLYFQRYIHHIAGLPDFSALKFTRYNQYESLILPMQKYLERRGWISAFGVEVTNVLFEHRDGKKVATAIECRAGGKEQGIPLSENDLVFVTNGSCTEGTVYGDQDHAPSGGRRGAHLRLLEPVEEHRPPGPRLWPAGKVLLLHRQDQLGVRHHHHPGRADPAVSLGHLPAGPPQRPGGHRRHRQLPGFQVAAQLDHQPPGPVQGAGPRLRLHLGSTACSLTCPVDYVKKPMRDCTGREITEEWLYHIGVPVEQIPELAAHSAVCVPTLMPYITAFFMPRAKGDRPDVIPDGCVNFAFLGQFAETPRDHRLYHRVFGPHRHGGGLRPAGGGPRRAGGLGQRL